TFNRLDQPMALGYSSAGTIISLGDGMEGFKTGQRVACAGGGYAVHAEYNLVPRNLLTPLPETVDFESAAFTTLGAIALHGFRLAEPQLGENVAVIGLGLLGLLTIQLAAAAGCRVFGVDTNPSRVQLAEQFGIAACSRQNAADSAVAFTANRGFDSVIICADTPSNDPVELAGVIARDRAKIVATGAVGLSFPRKIYYEKELSFINSRSYGPGRYDAGYEENGQDYPIGFVRWTEGRNFQAIVALMAQDKLRIAPLVTHRIPIENAAEAYEIITGKQQEPFLGVLLKYPSAQGDKETSTSLPVYLSIPTTAPKTATVKLGVLGAGLFANATLLPAMARVKDIELVGIASAGGLHAQHSGKKFGFRYAASDDEQIINDPAINTVMILTRHDTHAELVVRALQAGKHVFVEKPLAVDQAGLEKVCAQLTMNCEPQTETERLSSSANGLLMVGFNRRFAPLATQLAAHFAQRTEPLYMHYRINAGYIPLNHWTHDPAQGGGRIIGEGCHFVDFLSFLAGSAPVNVCATALPNGGKYREDNVSMTFTFADGSLGVVDYLASGDKSFPKERVEVFCDGAVAVLDDFRSLETVRNGKRKTVKLAGQDKGHFNEMQVLVSAIRAGQAPIAPEQLVAVTKATFAAVESLRKNGEKVVIE
ncbi:MAG: bi-domain-containing oxidoreductase, partial [Chloroflexi bacterium]|nr:bi-domain-containing oxidoreductase [Chloroflexota bacterium]